MGRRRKNPEHEKLPPNVYPNKYSYVSVTLTAIKDGLAALWKKYEETVNNRDRAMTFGR
ncbi:integrase, partial [Escherichia coli]